MVKHRYKGNSTYGSSKDPYNDLYDPLQANNTCISGQLLLVDLIDKLHNKCQLININTDGILIKLFNKEDREVIIAICEDFCKRTRLALEYDNITKVVQRDVNNYLIVMENGKVKAKGVVKDLSELDNNLPIVNEAVKKYFTDNIPVSKTIMQCNSLMKFQMISKTSHKYDYAYHNGKPLQERVNRVFASLDGKDTTLYKKHKDKSTLDKSPSVPLNCFIDNSNVTDKPVPPHLDKQWYIDTANDIIKSFIGG